MAWCFEKLRDVFSIFILVKSGFVLSIRQVVHRKLTDFWLFVMAWCLEKLRDVPHFSIVHSGFVMYCVSQNKPENAKSVKLLIERVEFKVSKFEFDDFAKYRFADFSVWLLVTRYLWDGRFDFNETLTELSPVAFTPGITRKILGWNLRLSQKVDS